MFLGATFPWGHCGHRRLCGITAKQTSAMGSIGRLHHINKLHKLSGLLKNHPHFILWFHVFFQGHRHYPALKLQQHTMNSRSGYSPPSETMTCQSHWHNAYSVESKIKLVFKHREPGCVWCRIVICESNTLVPHHPACFFCFFNCLWEVCACFLRPCTYAMTVRQSPPPFSSPSLLDRTLASEILQLRWR